MGLLLDIFGMAGTLATLYDYISEKLKDDNKSFKSQIHKNIQVICKDAFEFLNESSEFKDIIPSFIDEVIYEEVVKALENKKLLNVDEIQKKLDIPRRDILDQLIKLIDKKLQTSFEYSQRDFNAWLRQEAKDIESSLGDIKKEIIQIQESLGIIKSGNMSYKKDEILKRQFFHDNAVAYSEYQFYEWKEKSERIYSILYKNNECIPVTLKDASVEINVSDCLTLLESRDCRHAILIGEGGMGKTYTCMTLGERYLKQDKQVIYIPLCDYSSDKSIKKSIIKTFGIESDSDYESLIDDDEIILLLDGYNEINAKFLYALFTEIKELRSKKCIQILLTSRSDVIHLETIDFTRFTFMPISNRTIDGWIEQYVSDGAKLNLSAELYDILRNPMLLKMYALNISDQVLIDNKQKSHFLNSPNTTGEIIWNFLEHQIIKAKAIYKPDIDVDGTDKGLGEDFGKILLRYLLPYIAYQVEKNEKSYFTLVDLEEYIDNFSVHFENNYKKINDLIQHKRTVNHFLNIEDKSTVLLKRCVDSFCIIKLRQIDSADDETYDFIHQHFRDILSATHIRNQMILNDKDVFIERNLPFHISRMLLEILQEHKYEPNR